MNRTPASSAPLGAPHTLTSVGGDDRSRQRLAELGLRPGANVTVLRRTAGQGRILAVAGSRVAVDAATANTLMLHIEKDQA
ncbi:hypothetical protein KEM60_02479 [Austwickia sp. TVS 96-490-7B]|uniref:FeoA family protein n=1 Tax=Austwickia sp. TVS 96-490-7B TaxID=2830843 RepID=UPI001C5983F4|nr:FeoA family protein [Austwickia sp. TVS 96-490-7B]MBW3086267.1 hypothetical protein [Austwickia sp. TVS 96-490-7B]